MPSFDFSKLGYYRNLFLFTFVTSRLALILPPSEITADNSGSWSDSNPIVIQCLKKTGSANWTGSRSEWDYNSIRLTRQKRAYTQQKESPSLWNVCGPANLPRILQSSYTAINVIMPDQNFVSLWIYDCISAPCFNMHTNCNNKGGTASSRKPSQDMMLNSDLYCSMTQQIVSSALAKWTASTYWFAWTKINSTSLLNTSRTSEPW